MPFALRENPLTLGPEDLDDFWAKGWFRMRQSLFTTHFLEFEQRFYSAVWLRFDLRRPATGTTRASLKRRNQRWRVAIDPAPEVPDAALEDLYERYRDSLDIEVAPSLTDLLFGAEERSIFSTRLVRLWDGERLIAAGILDLGQQAAAGIVCFFDPEYRRFSLGKYLIYLKMEYCRQQGLTWFYPGYFVPGRPRFDYKLGLAPEGLEWLDLASGTWLPWQAEASRPDPLARMTARLQELQAALADFDWPPILQYNEHLGIHLNPQIRGVELFDFPVFLQCFPPASGPYYLLVVFDPRDGLYHLLQARSVFHVETEPTDPQIFSSELLVVERLVFSTAQPSPLAQCLRDLARIC